MSSRGAIDLLDGAGGWFAFGLAAAASFALSVYLTRATTFSVDELFFFSSDRGYDLQVLLSPHNGHLILVPRLIYSTVFKLFGPTYIVFRLIVATLTIAGAALFFALARRRIGGALSLGPSLILLFFGSGSALTLDPNGIHNMCSVVAGLVALLAFARRGRYADPLACIFLVGAVASWSFGVAVAIGVAVAVLQRADRWRRAWIFAIPLGLYAIWWLAKSNFNEAITATPLQPKVGNVLLYPQFVADSIATITASLAGLAYDFSQPVVVGGANLDVSWGPALVAIAAIAIALRLRRSPAPSSLWPLVAILAFYWASITIGLSAGRSPESTRYLYPAAVIMLLVGAELAAGIRVREPAVVAILAVSFLALGANVKMLGDTSNYLRGFSNTVRADLAAIELSRDRVDPSFVPDAGLISIPAVAPAVRAEAYLGAVDRIGSFADSAAELGAASEEDREQADQILAQALQVRLAPAPPPQDRSGCGRTEAKAGAPLELRVPPRGALLRTNRGSSAQLRRFALSYAVSLPHLNRGRFYSLRIPTDAATAPWWEQLTPATEATVCPLR